MCALKTYIKRWLDNKNFMLSYFIRACDHDVLAHALFEVCNTVLMQAFPGAGTQRSNTHCGFLALSRKEFKCEPVYSLKWSEFIREAVR